MNKIFNHGWTRMDTDGLHENFSHSVRAGTKLPHAMYRFPLPSTGRGIKGEGWYDKDALVSLAVPVSAFALLPFPLFTRVVL